MQRIRVGIIVDYLDPGGISTSLFEESILREFDSSNEEVLDYYVFTYSDLRKIIPRFTNKLKYISILDFENIFNRHYKSKFVRLINKMFLNRFTKKIFGNHLVQRIKDMINVSALDRAVRSERIDIVYQIYSERDLSIPYIATCLDCNELVHSYLPEFGGQSFWSEYDIYRTKYLRKAAFIIVGTEILKDQVSQFYGISKEKIITIPFFTPEIEKKSGSVNKGTNNISIKDFLFYPARYMPQKNHIVIIEALKILKDKGFNPPVIFCGVDKGNKKYLEQKTYEYELDKHIHFFDLVDFSTLTALYKTAKACLFTPFNGPDNLPPLEAFSLKCPVIASNVSGAVEQLGDAALLFEPTDEQELANMIIRIYSDEDLCRTLIEKGLENVKYKTVQNYVDSIKKIIIEFSKILRAWDSTNYKILGNQNSQ